MGQTRKRDSSDGRLRYTAYYVDVAGRRRSAGTFATKREADRAWQRAESKVAEGRVDDKRFMIKPYPKDQEWRQVSLSRHISDQLLERMEGLDADDLLFRAPEAVGQVRRRPDVLPDPATLGLTEPNAAGRQYAHGTISAYSTAPCHCRYCKDAYALYRATRRNRGLDQPRAPKSLTTDGHIPRSYFRLQVWGPTLAKAGLDIPVRFHDLRHAHASWLLAAGADLQVVKERMGHASITTTEKYLHSLPGADASAVVAIDAIRKRTG